MMFPVEEGGKVGCDELAVGTDGDILMEHPHRSMPVMTSQRSKLFLIIVTTDWS